ncbi:hypothetical protein ASC77_18015 [Nocardioides sp. Root1257]|nr:hypothetical protein ASC77_18015 [Nocardioides sp. Root1257]KRC43824.1 hypothetical protein ASE24_18970 [Nocardioides sp. Root224]
MTDDDLTRQLGGAFRDATDDLEYAGRVPTPRSAVATVGVPLASTAAVVAALAVVWASAPGTDDPTPPTTAGPSAVAPPIVTRTIEVAGFSFSYRGEARADDLYARMSPGAVPEDAQPIDAPDGVQAWVGTDPQSGDHALYVDAPTRNGGKLFALLSPTWTAEQLTDLFLHGQPRTVPAVS